MAVLPNFVKASTYDYKATYAPIPVGIVLQGNYISTHYRDNSVYETLAITLWPITPIFYFYVGTGVKFDAPSSSYPVVKLYVDFDIINLWGCNLWVFYTDDSSDVWAVSGSHYYTYTLDSYKEVDSIEFIGYSMFIPGSVKIDYAMIRYQT
jgi:hypothetical protein